MLKKYIALLNEVRSGRRDIAEFNFHELPENEKNEFDANQLIRYKLLLALQHNLLPSDEPLLQHLFRQEILRARNDPFQGIGNAMYLNARLLSSFKNVANVWLFTEAKFANFDTFCGLDYEYLVSAGIEATYQYVQQNNSPFKEHFYENVGESIKDCSITADELTKWEHRCAEQNNITLDSLENQIELAIELKEYDLLSEKVAEWKASQQDWDADKWYTLAHYANRSNNIPEEIFAREQQLKLEKNSFSLNVLQSELCALHIKNKDADKAWKLLKAIQAGARYRSQDNIEKAFSIVAIYNNPLHKEAQEIYNRAKKEFTLLPEAQVVTSLLETIAKAALIMNDTDTYKKAEAAIEASEKQMQELTAMLKQQENTDAAE